MGGKGDITLFYSGSYGDISAQEIVKAMERNGDNIRIIDNTQVAKLIDADEFKIAVGKALGIADPQDIEIAYNDRTTPSSLNQFFFDAENGLWADASRRFAAETVGEVRTLTANARNDRTFALVELEGILHNQNITYIDGIDRTRLLDVYDNLRASGSSHTSAMGVVFDAVTARSYDASASLHYNVTNLDGKSVQYIDSRDYFKPYGIEGHVNDANITYKALPLAPPTDAHLAGRATNEGIAQAIGRDLAGIDASLNPDRFLKLTGDLRNYGYVGDAVGLAWVLNDANAAYQAGDTDKAKSLLSDWLISLGGGYVAAGAALEAISPFLAATAATGPVGVVVAGGVGLFTAFVAGYFGSEFSVKLAHWLDTLFGETTTYTDPLALDLDGDGIETIASDGKVLFDFNEDGVKTGTGWLSSDDALLVLDRNNDGIITSGVELFGTDTLSNSGEKWL